MTPWRPGILWESSSGASDETILVPLNLTEQQIDDLVAFLGALTDEALDPALTVQPAGPAQD